MKGAKSSLFLSETLLIDDESAVTEVFRDFLETKTDLYSFEESLNEHGMPYEKIAFY